MLFDKCGSGYPFLSRLTNIAGTPLQCGIVSIEHVPTQDVKAIIDKVQLEVVQILLWCLPLTYK